MSEASLIRRKLRRMRSVQPRVLDLFAGCGGLSLGFHTAGAQIVGAVESNPQAVASHHLNFKDGDEGPVDIDIADTTPAEALKELGIRGDGPLEDQVDILIGGPPCQAFARIGRAKLRAEALRRKDEEAAIAHLNDERTKLYLRYLNYVRSLKPVAIVLENVPDILNHGGRNIAEEICEQLTRMGSGYVVRYSLLNSCFYGVPQVRERMFLVAVHEAADIEPGFPVPTHHHTLKEGYKGIRTAALRHVGGSVYYREPPAPAETVPATTARQGIGDLPPIYALEELERGTLGKRQTARDVCEYGQPGRPSNYARLMRGWSGFEADEAAVEGHIIRYLPRDFKFFRVMGEGWDYPRIHAHVEAQRNALLKRRRTQGLTTDGRNPEVAALVRNWTIPYDVAKFANKWWKLSGNEPSRTLMAHLGKDSYSHIHYCSDQARTISVREAARLQSFPDGFRFAGGINSAFQQIGNAVPPLVSYAIARRLLVDLECEVEDDLRRVLLGVAEHVLETESALSA